MSALHRQGARIDHRRSRVVAERVDHRLERLDLIDDRVRRAVEDFGLVGRQAAEEAAAQALGRELDRRERILHLVGEPPRDLGPGRVALRAVEYREVVEHDDDARVVTCAAEFGATQHQHAPLAAAGIEHDLPAPLARGLAHMREDRVDQRLPVPHARCAPLLRCWPT